MADFGPLARLLRSRERLSVKFRSPGPAWLSARDGSDPWCRASAGGKLGLEGDGTSRQGRPIALTGGALSRESVDRAPRCSRAGGASDRAIHRGSAPPHAGTLLRCGSRTRTWWIHSSGTPRLAVRAPTRGCGKTTLLDVIGRGACALATENISTAALFRTIEAGHPTLFIDEFDTGSRDNDELREILNSGHRQGGRVVRASATSMSRARSRPLPRLRSG